MKRLFLRLLVLLSAMAFNVLHPAESKIKAYKTPVIGIITGALIAKDAYFLFSQNTLEKASLFFEKFSECKKDLLKIDDTLKQLQSFEPLRERQLLNQVRKLTQECAKTNWSIFQKYLFRNLRARIFCFVGVFIVLWSIGTAYETYHARKKRSSNS